MIVSSMVTAALVGGAISGGTQIASGIMQNRANNKAMDAQTSAADKALAFEREQFDAEQQRLQPYRELGSQAYQRIGNILGLSAPGGAGPRPPSPPPAGQWSMPRPQQPQPMTPAQAPSSFNLSRQPARTVQVRHPRTGEVRSVPEWQAQTLTQRGGQVVG